MVASAVEKTARPPTAANEIAEGEVVHGRSTAMLAGSMSSA